MSHPLPSGSLYAREAELRSLRDHFVAPGLVTLWGPPGVGKTRLALELIRSDARDAAPPRGGHGRAWFVDLTRATDRDQVVAAIAVVVGVKAVGGALAATGATLRRRAEPLLVLDNFEHLVETASDVVGELLAQAANLRVLVTSRAPLRCAGERIVEVLPLGLPRPGEDPLASPAVRLLHDRMGGRGEPSAEHGRVLCRVAAAVDGLPLALELAAAHLRLTGWGVAAEALPAARSARAGSHEGGRHASMGASLRWSWDLLDPARQRALALSSLFPSSFDAAAATRLWGEGAPADLAALVERQLVAVVGPGRFQLFQVIRELAAGQLEALLDGEARRAAQGALEDYYLAIAEAGVASFEQRGAVGEAMMEELDNIVATADRAEARGRVEVARRAALALAPAMITRGLIAAHAARVERLAEARPEDAALLHARGFARYLSANLDGAQADLEAALARVARDQPRLAATVGKDLGCVHQARRRLREARACYERALAALGAEPSERLRALLAGNLGTVDHDLGRFERAEATYRDALKGFRAVGDIRLEGIFSTNLAVLEVEQGRMVAARSRYQRALELLVAAGDIRLQAITLGNWGVLEHAAGDVEAARARYERALELLSAVGEPRTEALCRARLGAALAAAGDVARAEIELEAAAEAVEGRDLVVLGVASLCRGFIDAANGRAAQAVERVERASLPDGSRLVDVSDDARTMTAILTRSLAVGAPALEVGEGEAWFRAPGADARDLRTYAAMRRVFARLVAERQSAPGESVDGATLFAAGWPKVTIAPESASNRLYVTLANLRKMGLKAWLLHDGRGYRLDPGLQVVRSKRRFEDL